MHISSSGMTVAGRTEDAVTISVSRVDQAASPYLYVPLDLPEGVEAITVTLDYARAEDCIIDLGLFDPRASAYPTADGFRGWSGGARNRICVTEKTATPGYVPGPMPAGRWLVALGLYQVPETGALVHLRVEKAASEPLVQTASETGFAPRGSGWYRGDCHCHTFHSDAAGSPEQLHETARRLGLDFVFVTDHNTTTAWQAYFRAASTSDLVFLPGAEITTARGHANVLGTERWIDFRLEGDDDIAVLERAVADAGALLSVNHDKPPIPWHYRLPETHLLELWHEEWAHGNGELLERYDALLRQGRRITAIGGSDYHQEATLRSDGSDLLGRPTTVVYAERLDRDGVLDALRQGRVYITESPQGPSLEISVDGVRMGGSVAGSQHATLSLVCKGAEGDRLLVVADDGPIAELAIDGDSFAAAIELPGGLGFVRAEIVTGAVGSHLAGAPRRALSNPVYFTSRKIG